jgi:hypothetical protein
MLDTIRNWMQIVKSNHPDKWLICNFYNRLNGNELVRQIGKAIGIDTSTATSLRIEFGVNSIPVVDVQFMVLDPAQSQHIYYLMTQANLAALKFRQDNAERN